MNMGWLASGTRAGGVLAVVLSSVAPGAGAQERFSISADGAEVTDNRTGLVWRRCSAGQTYGGGTCTGNATEFTHEGALAYATSQPGWRLPNVKELSSIVDTGRTRPAIDTGVFPNTRGSSTWSSSPSAGGSPYVAWVVGFTFGTVSTSSLASQVRLVR